MPRIPTYSPQQGIGAQPVNVKATEAVFTGYGDGKMGEGLQVAANALMEIQRSNEKVWVNDAVTAARSHWMSEMERRKNSAELGAPEFTKRISYDWNKFVDEQLKAAPSRSAQAALQDSFNDLGLRLQADSMQFEAQQRTAKVAFDIEQSIDRSAALMIQDQPTAQRLDTMDATYEEQGKMIESVAGRVPPDVRLRLQNARQKIASSALNVMAATDPEGALEALQAGRFNGKMDGTHIANAYAMLQSRVQAVNSARASALGKDWDENIKAIENFGTPRLDSAWMENFARLSGKKSAVVKEKMAQDLSDAYSVFSYAGKAIYLNPAQRDELRRSYRPKGTDENDSSFRVFKRIEAWEKADAAERKKDIAGYAQSHNPAISAMFQEAQTKVAQAQELDEGVPQRAELLAAATKTRAQAYQDMTTFQDMIGVPAGEQRILTKAQAQHYAQTISQGRPEQAEQAVRELEATVGRPNMAKAVAGLMDVPAAEGGLQPLHQLYLLNYNTSAGAYILDVLRQKPEEIRKSIAPEDAQSIQNTVRRNPFFTNMAQALSNTPTSGVPYVNGLREASEMVAPMLIQKGIAKGPKEAADKAVDMFVKRAFEVQTMRDRKFLVPNVSPQDRTYTAEEKGLIGYNLEQWTRWFADRAEKMVDQRSFGQWGLPPDAVVRELAPGNIRRRTFPVLTADGQFYELWMANERGDAFNTVPLLSKKDGRTIRLPVDHLARQKMPSFEAKSMVVVPGATPVVIQGE